jgi:nucleotidyltransferase/DNA polymerase involved in DNA repair
VLEHASPAVEPHGWGAAYVDLGDLARQRADAVPLGQQIGRAVRKELGTALQPALGWDSTKFTARAAARQTQAGRLLAVAATRERAFLRPLPVTLLPLPEDALQRLGFLGLRTLGQYAALSVAAVGQQFGRGGVLAHRCARGEDSRPILPRSQTPQLAAHHEFDVPSVEREWLLTALGRLVSPLLSHLRENLQACGQVKLTMHFDDGSSQERTRVFLSPTAERGQVVRALEQLLDGLHWPAAATALGVSLEQIQEAVIEQMSLFAAQAKREHTLQEVQRHLAARFGTNLLRRAVLAHPGAPLPEWRTGWLADGAP